MKDLQMLNELLTLIRLKKSIHMRKQNNLFKALIAIFFMAVFVSTAAGQEKETRTIGDFTRISVGSGIDLYITQGDNIELVVEATKDRLHKIITEVKDNQLKIYTKDKYNWGWDKAPKVYLTFKQLERLTAGGGADVYGKTIIKAEKLQVTTSGGADAYLHVQTEKLKLITSGGSDIKIKGETQTLYAEASGGSDINAKELKAQSVKVSTSGGADASVWAEKEITASASGGSDIDFYGNPEVKNLNESGAGDISQK